MALQPTADTSGVATQHIPHVQQYPPVPPDAEPIPVGATVTDQVHFVPGVNHPGIGHAEREIIAPSQTAGIGPMRNVPGPLYPADMDAKSRQDGWKHGDSQMIYEQVTLTLDGDTRTSSFGQYNDFMVAHYNNQGLPVPEGTTRATCMWFRLSPSEGFGRQVTLRQLEIHGAIRGVEVKTEVSLPGRVVLIHTRTSEPYPSFAFTSPHHYGSVIPTHNTPAPQTYLYQQDLSAADRDTINLSVTDCAVRCGRPSDTDIGAEAAVYLGALFASANSTDYVDYRVTITLGYTEGWLPTGPTNKGAVPRPETWMMGFKWPPGSYMFNSNGEEGRWTRKQRGAKRIGGQPLVVKRPGYVNLSGKRTKSVTFTSTNMCTKCNVRHTGRCGVRVTGKRKRKRSSSAKAKKARSAKKSGKKGKSKRSGTRQSGRSRSTSKSKRRSDRHTKSDNKSRKKKKKAGSNSKTKARRNANLWRPPSAPGYYHRPAYAPYGF